MTAIIFLILRILLSLSLYAFLMMMFFTLWNDIRQQGNWVSKRKVPVISLSIQALDFPLRILHFDTDEVTIGRDPSCSCCLEDENVSNHHARLKYHHNQWWLEDLGSTNGTLINQHPVSTPIVVISGDEIECGKHILTIEISGNSLHNSVSSKANIGDGENNV